MSELEDFEKEPTIESESSELPRWPYWVGGLVLIAVIVVVVILRSRQEEVQEEPPPARPEVAETMPGRDMEKAPLEIGELPQLDVSDAWTRDLLGQLSAHPELAEWLVTDEMIRRFVAVVDNVAEGTSPRSHLPFMQSEEAFKVEERNGRFIIDPASYQRYDTVVEVVASIDSEGAAQVYTALLPLFREAYRDLGYPGRSFDDAMQQAVDRLLETPVVTEEIEVVAKVSSFELADPELEGLSAAAKHFLRFGPQNLRRLQAKVEEVGGLAGLEVN